VHHVGILYDQFMMHGQRNIKEEPKLVLSLIDSFTPPNVHEAATKLAWKCKCICSQTHHRPSNCKFSRVLKKS